MTKFRLAVALFAAFALFAVACSSSGGDDAGGDDQADEAVDGGEQEGEAPEPGVLVDQNTDYVFCDPEQDPDVEPVSVDEVGVTDDSIKVGAIVVDLSQVGVELGSYPDYFGTFVDYVNDECGGINGRTLDLTLYEISATGLDDRRGACISSTEDDGNFIVVNPNGFQGDAVNCITETNETLLLTIQGQAAEQYEASDGRLWTSGLSFTRSLEAMVLDLDDRGLLDGETIGVVYPDTPFQPEAVQDGVIDLLDELGHDVAVSREVPCNNTSVCTDGVPLIVEEMASAGVTVVLPTLNVISTGPFVQEAAIQGFEPTWYNSGFNNMDGETTNAILFASGVEAAENYDGTQAVTTASGALYRVDPDNPATTARVCNEIYQAAGGDVWDYADPDFTDNYGATAGVCGQVRLIYQVLTAAGPELTQDAVIEAWENLGEVPLAFTKGTYGPGKYWAPDQIRTVQVTICDEGKPAGDIGISVCVEAVDDYRPIPVRP